MSPATTCAVTAASPVTIIVRTAEAGQFGDERRGVLAGVDR